MNTKRVFDIAASVTGLAVLSPVLAVVAGATAVKFGGNPLHLVERMGKDGKPFKMIKFKSMADKTDAEGNSLPDEQRLDTYGRFLRFTSLDELPQLVNIAKGDMSFVGPRPRSAALKGDDAIPETHKEILSVQPGLTGPWQVKSIGKDRAPLAERLDTDLAYAKSPKTLMSDIYTMVTTVPAVVQGHGGETLRKKETKPSTPQQPNL